jgi:D-arginine dehydrogenase
MRSAEVVVIGGGILGAAVAYTLAARGERNVVVLEAESALNRHSTGRSAAYYIPMYESLAYASLAKASLPFLKDPPQGFSDRPVFSQDGALIAAIEGHAASVKKEMAQAQSLGIEVRNASADDIRELVPIARPEKIEAAAFYPEAGEIDVGGLSQAYIRGAKQLGVRFLLADRFGGTRLDQGRIVGVIAASGEIACRSVVNAAGAWAGEVATLAKASTLPVFALRRHLLRVRLPGTWSAANWPFFRCPSLPLYYKPSGGELSFSPMDAEADRPRDCPVDPARVASAIRSLNEYTTLPVRPEDVIAVAGHRVFGADHGPIVGEDQRLPRFYWAAALGGSGIMAAPAVADVIASAILGDSAPLDMTALAPARFDGRVDGYVAH